MQTLAEILYERLRDDPDPFVVHLVPKVGAVRYNISITRVAADAFRTADNEWFRFEDMRSIQIVDL